jgi:UDP-glucose-4-epimerase GalE
MIGSTVLVTGGAGYIGSHACKALAAAGHTPVTLDNLVHGNRSAVQWGPFELGDIRDTPRLESVMRRHRPRAVMHFAGFAYVGESVTAPAKYYDNNVLGSLSLLSAMQACEIDLFVFSSSCATYGIPPHQPINESTPQLPINPYGMTKLIIERALADYDVAYGLRSVRLRYFNATGADPAGEIGENHDPETHLIPRALMAATGEISALEVFGTDYPTTDGTCVRDYIHVSDLAVGHVQALDYLLKGGRSLSLNLGTGHGVSVQEIVRAVTRVTGRPVPLKHSPRRAGDPAILIADPTMATEVLGFSPSFTEIEPIIETAWRWCRRSITELRTQIA